MLAKHMLVAVAMLGLAAPVWADDDEGPGRGVARISVINGDVSIRRSDSGDTVAAALNAPLVVQDHVFTGAGSRTELQFDWANMLRISSHAEVRLAELEYRRYMVQVARGTVTWRVLRDQEAYVEISTPNVSVRPVRRGTYRVTVFEDGSSEITVRSGEAEIFTPRGSERLKSGRTMMARGTQADPEFRIVSEIREDEWDRWNEYRDKDLERSRSYSYVSRDIYGAEDLDHHGRWVYVAAYGWVWCPRVAVGWAPYRYGRWTWIDFYGWTWVSYDPWGWAPYHYGRWFYHGPYGWCWWPGSLRARHYWAPGLVAFFGFGGGGVSVGLGWGRVGWIPLAPHDPFHRWWGPRWYGGYRNRTYIDNSVTVVNNINVTNVYRNARVGNAVTVVDQDGFSRGRSGSSVRLTDGDFARVSLARGPLPVAPARESLRLADREATVRGTETRTAERFFSHRQPAQVERVSFEEQRSGIERIARRSFGEEAVRGTSSPERGSRAAAAESPARSEEPQRGWRRVDESPRGSTAERFGTTGRGAERTLDRGSDTEWRRFGSARVGEADHPGRGSSSRSFGEPVSPRVEQRSPARPEASSDGWVRFGDRNTRWDRGSDANSSPSWRRETAPRSEPRSESRSESPRWERSSPRMESPRYESQRMESPRMERRSETQSIRISPPIVRERGGDFSGSRGGGGDRGGDIGRSSRGDGGGSPRGGGGEGRGGRGR